MIQVVRETHRAPASVARRLEIAGGVNRFGRPNYRAVWGWSRLGWIGGKWEGGGTPARHSGARPSTNASATASAHTTPGRGTRSAWTRRLTGTRLFQWRER